MIPFERALLGVCLLDASVFPKINGVLRADHFTPDARIIFVSMRELHEKAESIDAVSVASKVGQPSEVDTLLENLPYPTDSAVETWVAGIKKAARRRRLTQEIAQLHDWTLDPDKDDEAVLERFREIERRVDSETQDGSSFDPMTLSRAGRTLAEELFESGGRVLGVGTGFHALDSFTGGFRAGQIITIGARPSVGKSSLALQIAGRAANAGQPVVFFSLEMEAADLALVRACAEAQVSKWELQNKKEPDHLRKIAAAFGNQANTPLYVEKLYSPTLGAIRASASRHKAQHNLALIVVDYLQLMQGESGGRDNRNEEITGIMKGLKHMASQLKCPVIVCAQLNREAAGKDSEKPRLSHFRDSGSIEAETDIALLLHRVNPKAEWSEPMDIDVLVEKNRTGSCGVVALTFKGKHQTFFERGKHQTFVDRETTNGTF